MTTDDVRKTKEYKALVEYICFILDSNPEDESQAKVFDSKRKAMHKEVANAFGFSRESYENWIELICDPDEWVNKRGNGVDELAVQSYWYIKDKLSDWVWGDIHTKFHAYDNIQKNFPKIEKNIKDSIEELKNLFKDADKAREALNERNNLAGRQVGTKARNIPYYWGHVHEFNGVISEIEYRLREMRSLYKLPRESYLAGVVTRYYDEPYKDIKDLIVRANGLIYMTIREFGDKENANVE